MFPQEITSNRLSSDYDVLILEDGAVPDFGRQMRGIDPDRIPQEYQNRLGAITIEEGIPEILAFVEQGGVVIAIGGSAVLGYHAGLPISDHLMEAGRPVTRDEYFTPGSIHSIRLENSSPLTHGLGEHLDVMISHSPVFSLNEGHEEQGVHRVGWFDTSQPLKSGWAWGQERMENGTALLEVQLGAGKMFLFSPKITFRAQSHAAFPLLFNGIFYGSAGRE